MYYELNILQSIHINKTKLLYFYVYILSGIISEMAESNCMGLRDFQYGIKYLPAHYIARISLFKFLKSV